MRSLFNVLIHCDFTEIGSKVHIVPFYNRLEVYSPGGMFERLYRAILDTDNVASKRNNLIIADI